MRITFLGTNGWYDTPTGNTVCILLETREYQIIMDAGNGIYKLDQYVVADKRTYLFLSHFHLDHIIGLHTLNKFHFDGGLWIFGPKGTKDALGTIINVPFSWPLTRLQYQVEIGELPDDQGIVPFRVQSLPLRHSSLTLGYRFEMDEGVVAYCPDTGYCENTIALAENANLLIAECAFRPGQESEEWPHLNPETAARIAKEASAKSLALVHFDASLYKTLEDRRQAEKVARTVFPDTTASFDGMQIEILQ